MLANVINAEVTKIEEETYSKCLVMLEGTYGVAWVKGVVENGDVLAVSIKPDNNLRFRVKFEK